MLYHNMCFYLTWVYSMSLRYARLLVRFLRIQDQRARNEDKVNATKECTLFEPLSRSLPHSMKHLLGGDEGGGDGGGCILLGCIH